MSCIFCDVLEYFSFIRHVERDQGRVEGLVGRVHVHDPVVEDLDEVIFQDEVDKVSTKCNISRPLHDRKILWRWLTRVSFETNRNYFKVGFEKF